MVESMRIAAKNGWHYFRWLPFIIFTVHFGLGWGFVKEALRSGKAGNVHISITG
jgi:hypothetical protein